MNTSMFPLDEIIAQISPLLPWIAAGLVLLLILTAWTTRLRIRRQERLRLHYRMQARESVRTRRGRSPS